MRRVPKKWLTAAQQLSSSERAVASSATLSEVCTVVCTLRRISGVGTVRSAPERCEPAPALLQRLDEAGDTVVSASCASYDDGTPPIPPVSPVFPLSPLL